MNQICSLCKSDTFVFYKSKKQQYYQCRNCKGIFLHRDQLLNPEKEKERYQKHKNSIEDMGYLKFVSPILNAVKNNFNSTHKGLDFGAGHTPVISEVLNREGYRVDVYDPVFFDHREFLDRDYDFIIACEVIEHFYKPKKEFELLYKMLKPTGKLICMTDIYRGADFGLWYYRTDPTHVFFYLEDTLRWIKDNIGFKDINIEERLIIYTK